MDSVVAQDCVQFVSRPLKNLIPTVFQQVKAMNDMGGTFLLSEF